MITLIFCVLWCYLHCFQYLIYTIQNSFSVFSSSMCINSSVAYSSIKCFKAAAFFDKTLYDDYLCLVASNQQQNWEMAKRRKSRKRRLRLRLTLILPESFENGQLLSGCGLVQSIAHRHFLVIGG